MDVLLVSPGPRLDETVTALRDAAEVYGWGIAVVRDNDATAVQVVPGTCTRRPEARRVLERARSMDAALVAGVEFVRASSAAGASHGD